MKLSTLGRGQSARITSVHHVPASIRHRLAVMGVIPGTGVELVRRAPLGDPLQIRLDSEQLIVRRDVAKLIDVEVI
ncbi:FeoA family protein [Salinivibrio kushneri]|uniref:FeoA family protein n=1 Tax=Salinivibrio kushneri TaxID=1908198 RepID=A0AA47LR35_9GAMM|nr:FeoA family protein [Salinivibrio kushneri]WBA07802.1 FeoA family protein [Salinivibrio kushneri]